VLRALDLEFPTNFTNGEPQITSSRSSRMKPFLPHSALPVEPPGGPGEWVREGGILSSIAAPACDCFASQPNAQAIRTGA